MEKRAVRSRLRSPFPPGFVLVLACALAVVGTARPASAQLVLGQYEDEAPLRTWNIFGVPSAQSLGLGGAGLARAWDVTAAMTNPALLCGLGRYAATLTASYDRATLFRYALVNTGVLMSRGNLAADSYNLAFGGFSARAGGWTFAAASGILESYGRPPAVVGDSFAGYALEFRQSGWLRAYTLAVARRVSGRLAAGVAVSLVGGRLRRSMAESVDQPPESYTITDERSESARGFFVNGGLTWNITEELAVALAARTPYLKKAEATSSLRYQAPPSPDIVIEAAAVNEYRQPWIVGAGMSWRLTDALSGVADATWFGWSRYAVTYFDETARRAFRDVVRAAGGLELRLRGNLFGRPAAFPLRIGAAWDPQPMIGPRSSYVCVSAGAGVRTGRLTLDAGGLFGREHGSGNGLEAMTLALTASWSLGNE